MKTLAKKHSELINEIGYETLLNLPDQVKEVLKTTTDLEVKVKMLEMIKKAL